MDGYFTQTTLLTVPVRRAAFSDRTAYVMAELSRLAYFKFEADTSLQQVLQQIRELMVGSPNLDKVIDLVSSQLAGTSGPSSGRDALEKILSASDFTLIDAFSSEETDAQGFVCVHKSQDVAILVFRGTELKYKDIKADIRAKLVKVNIGDRSFEVHEGYYNQFKSLEESIRSALAQVEDKQLLITGHSLGGALAIVSTKILANDTTGACYTFGSPPVGTSAFDRDIKTPIYRIVNHVDIVPHLPSPVIAGALRGLIWLATVVLQLAPFVSGFFRWIGRTTWYQGVAAILPDIGRYRQSGYGSYLIGDGGQVQLRYTLDPSDKFRQWGKALLATVLWWRRDVQMFSDHHVATYVQKLANWAIQRTRS